MLKEIFTLPVLLSFYPCKSQRSFNYYYFYMHSHVIFRILERTSALVLELLQREEELKKAKTQVYKNIVQEDMY